MKLRLYHHHDGARIAYREAGTGPPLALLHSAGLSHREWEPLVEELGDRFRLVLPDLPLHGDSEDRPRHPYSPDWLAEVLAGFVRDTCGPRPLVGGHETGALLLLRAVLSRRLQPGRLVLMSSSLHRPPLRPDARRQGGRARGRACPAWTAWPRTPRGSPSAPPRAPRSPRAATRRRATSSATPRCTWAATRTARVPGARPSRRWPREQPELLDAYRLLELPVLLLWADEDASHPLAIAEEALDLLPDAMLRVLPGTGFLMAYDDPVGLARELAAFCL